MIRSRVTANRNYMYTIVDMLCDICMYVATVLQSRLTGKRPVSYIDDDSDDDGGGGEEVSFSGTSRSKKAKTSNTTFDMVDVGPLLSLCCTVPSGLILLLF